MDLAKKMEENPAAAAEIDTQPTHEKRTYIDADLALAYCGNFPRYQWGIGLYLVFQWVVWAMQNLSPAFVNLTPPMACVSSQGNDSTISYDDGTEACFVYQVGNFSGKKLYCGNGETKIVYEEAFGQTVVSEFGLTCEHSYYSQLSPSVMAIGACLASFIVTQLADVFGRRKVFIFHSYLWALISVLYPFVPNHLLLNIASFIMGFAHNGTIFVGWVLIAETMPLKVRAFMPPIGAAMWPVGYCFLGGLAYILPNWRHLMMALALPPLIYLTSIVVVPESVHWLLAHNRETEAIELLERIGRYNGRKIDIAACRKEKAEEKGKEVPSRTFLDVFKFPLVIFYLFVWIIIQFVVNMIYLGMSLQSTTVLETSRFLGFISSGIVELPAAILGGILVHIIGRRAVVIVAFVVCGLAMTGFFLVPGKGFLSLPFWLVGKGTNVMVFNSMDIYLPEMTATTIRNGFYGFTVGAGHIGSILAPQTAALGNIIPKLSALTFAVLCFICGVLAVFLPETKGKHMPVDLPDVRKGPVIKRLMKSFGRGDAKTHPQAEFDKY